MMSGAPSHSPHASPLVGPNSHGGAAHAAATPAEIIGPYLIGKTIGSGIFAKVKLGEDEFRQKVAIKIFDKRQIASASTSSNPTSPSSASPEALLSPTPSANARAHQILQLEKEINSLRACSHPHIVQFYDVLETSSALYLVMEHLTGGELYDYILDRGRLQEEEAGRLFGQILSAVDHCHARGIVHRDLKPENVLITQVPLAQQHEVENSANALNATAISSANSSSAAAPGFINVCKLVDFGLATGYDPSMSISVRSLSTQCGSPHYASPEILSGQKYSGPLSDIWSLGVLLYAMLCGSLPFNARSVPLLTKKILSGNYKFPKFLSPASRDLITSILQIQPEARATLAEIKNHPWIMRYGQLDRIHQHALHETEWNAHSVASSAAPYASSSSASASASHSAAILTTSAPSTTAPNGVFSASSGSQQFPIAVSEAATGSSVVLEAYTASSPSLSASSSIAVNGVRAMPSLSPSPLMRPLSRPEIINPEGARPLPGDLQRMMSKHQANQRRSIPSSPSAASTPSLSPSQHASLDLSATHGNSIQTLDLRSLRENDELDKDDQLALPPSASLSLQAPPSPLPSTSRSVASAAVSSSSSSSSSPPSASTSTTSSLPPPPVLYPLISPVSFIADLLSPRRRQKTIACQFCGKALNPHVSSNGEFVLSTPSITSVFSSKSKDTEKKDVAYELCTCVRARSYSPVSEVRRSISVSSVAQIDVNPSNKMSTIEAVGPASSTVSSVPTSSPSPTSQRGMPMGDSLSSANGFQTHSLRENYFHPDDPRRKTRPEPKILSPEEVARAEEEALIRLSNERLFLKACEVGDVDTVKLLIEPPQDADGFLLGAPLVDVARAKGVDNWCGLHFAARAGHLAVVQALLSSLQPLDINARSKSSWSALMFAAARGFVPVCSLLLKYGAAIHITNAEGKSAIFLARESGHHEIALMLTAASSERHKRHALLNSTVLSSDDERTLKNEGEESSVSVRELNYELFRAAEYGDVEKVRHLLALKQQQPRVSAVSRRAQPEPQPPAVVVPAVESDSIVSPSSTSSSNTTASSSSSSTTSASALPSYRYSVDVCARGIDHWTALHFAARKGRSAIVDMLLRHEPPAPVNAVTKNGWTPLMLACDKGYVDIVATLLRHGADVHVVSLDGSTAATIAQEAQHLACFDLVMRAAGPALPEGKDSKLEAQTSSSFSASESKD